MRIMETKRSNMPENRRRRRWLAGTIGISAVIGLSVPGAPAEAKPKPKSTSLTGAKQQLAALNNQVDQLTNQYNKAKSELTAAQGRVKALNKSVTVERKKFNQLHLRVAQLANSAYQSGDTGSVPSFIGAKNPEDVLGQMSAFTQISRNRSSELTQFVESAQLVEREKALAQQAADQLEEKRKQLDAQHAQAQKAIKKQLKLIAKLGGNIDPGSSKENCSILASGKREKVLKFACAQLGEPYVMGGAGPGTWDCSGLTMMAYKQVGIKLNHWVPDQYDASKRVAKADLQPGDMVFFHDNGHVGMYVGQGKFIHAPHTGDVVKISPLSDAWYTSNYVGGGSLL